MPPQLSHLHPSIETSLKDPAFSDPYLSAPLDPDQADFRSSAIRLTPVPEGASSPGPSSDLHPSGAPSLDTTSVDQSAFQPDNNNVSVLNPGGELLSNPSTRGSPNADHRMTGLNLSLNPAELSNWQPSQDVTSHTPESIQLSSPQPILPSAQLLSPILTHDPSPSSDVTNHSFFLPGNDALLSPESSQKLPPLITSPISDALSVHKDPESARARSPIVRVESVSRGDSPVGGANYSRRPSSAYLSPGGVESDDGDEMEDDISVVSRAPDGSWVRDMTTGQAGVDPTSRSDALVPSPNEMEAHRELGEKNAVIHSWTASVSAATSEAGDDEFLGVGNRSRKDRPGNRRRAKSTGDPSLQQDYFDYRSRFDNPSLPGPGVLVQENSDEGSSEFEYGSGSGSPVASVLHMKDETNHDNDISLSQPNPEDEEPLPRQFIRVRPWQDPAQDPFPKSTKMQPHNSSAAMMEFQRRARELDTASRFATWGTRNLSQVEVNGIIGGDSMGKLTIGDKEKGKQERRSNLRNLFPRATSPLKRQRSEITLNTSAPDSDGVNQDDQNQAGLQKKTSTSSHRRKLSLGRSPRSPSLSAGGAMAAIAGGMASIGTGARLSPGPTTRPTWPRGRSKSEIPLPPAPGLMDLMTTHGGPPVANPGYSATARQSTGPEPVGNDAGREDEEGDDDDEGLVMEFPVQSHLPVPTLDGFRTQITQLNPRLAPPLLGRLANEQLHRYKKLVDHKSTHARMAGTKSCTSGKYCFGQGGEAKILPPRTSAQDPDAAQTQFQVAGHDATDADPQSGEGTVTAAQFPQGVPLPPVHRLPAEFECPICFKVKKFQKPSDWSKHVHEDVQPFTCTFPHCIEPKSFKRKADWVRHESERHRQLEWWTCTIPDCNHTCYRKDNFVQHLVREHKMTEPKGKKSSKTRGNGSEESQWDWEVEQVWVLVERCRHETTKTPRDEPCRFCGNICSSWKKLTVHLAKHMEQLALPVLGLVQERDIPPTHTNSSPAAISRSNAPLTGLPLAFGQSNSYSGNPTTAFNPAYAPSVTSPQDGFLSTEPEAMNPCEEMASDQFLHPGVEHHAPLHQNSVTYPPPFNAVSRPRTPNRNPNSIPDVNVYSPNPIKVSGEEMEPVYDSQGPMYMSPTTEGDYSYPDPMATSLSYDSGVRNHMQNQNHYM